MSRGSFTSRVADLFLSRPNVWIDALELQEIGGRLGSRTRISNCRTELGMCIENRLRRETGDGSSYIISEYRYVPSATAAA